MLGVSRSGTTLLKQMLDQHSAIAIPSESYFVSQLWDCHGNAPDPDDFVRARLYPDMAPFHFQIEALTHHAVWGLEAVKTGVFAPPPLVGAMPFTDLRAIVGEAVTALEVFTPNEVNSWSGKDLDIAVFRPVDEENASTSAWARPATSIHSKWPGPTAP